MSYSPIASGFFVIQSNGQPVLEEMRQMGCALVFLNQNDAEQYRQQLCELRNVSKIKYAIAAMPLHHIQRLLSHVKVRVCIIEDWEATVA
jgi:hypothetical protein